MANYNSSQKPINKIVLILVMMAKTKMPLVAVVIMVVEYRIKQEVSNP
jgi:hypothetical protein